MTSDPYTDRWLVKSQDLYLTTDGLLTRFRDKAGVFDYGDACRAVCALSLRHQPARCVRVRRATTENVTGMTRAKFASWFERYQT